MNEGDQPLECGIVALPPFDQQPRDIH
jgi:hypothetical protein